MKMLPFVVFFCVMVTGMKKKLSITSFCAALLFLASPAWAHFGMVIPSDNMVMQNDNRDVSLRLSFSHPMEMIGMDLVKPKVFRVLSEGQSTDLLGKLQTTLVMDHPAWQLEYRFKRPGIYKFYMEPQPYWEPTEDVFIIHYTQTVIAAFGDDEGWDTEIGLKTEIVPMSKPFGLYTGNVFQGIVKFNQQPVPYAEVEVEYYNQDGQARAPTEYMITQTIKADPNGVFTYAAPAPGWWGFAALNEADFKLKTAAGEEKAVELGAVIWVRFEKWQD